ncbi:hypothetical protein EV696_107118 [Permianibacter aggregans]|uniref:Uncharacterized protein n=2 Tax=Permianibacter aggregans TaxID=1510150 RepID=A0A4R6UNJ4_9GAMM|nr:hypothetical protein EV696_107118 [Permianibacter aggregans]
MAIGLESSAQFALHWLPFNDFKMVHTMLKTLSLVMAVCSLAACVHHGPVHPAHGPVIQRSGPPPHAPAHGYRHKQGGVDLSFDSGLGVYVVIGHPGYYFWDNLYWWYHDGFWRSSPSWGGSYIVVSEGKRVPPGLAKKHGHGHGKSEGKGKSKDKGKGKDKKDK